MSETTPVSTSDFKNLAEDLRNRTLHAEVTPKIVSEINPELICEIKRIIEDAGNRRDSLFKKGHILAKTKKTLTVISGCLALLSASAITSTLVLFLGNTIIQIIGAIAATISGVISIIITSYYNDIDVIKTANGASKYLDLSERAHSILINPRKNSDQAYSEFLNIQKDYANLDLEFAQYLSSDSRFFDYTRPGDHVAWH